MARQLTLGVKLRDDARFANFYIGKNHEVVAQLQKLVALQGEQFIYLWGNVGAGCSHLLQACCHQAHAQQHTATYLPLSQLKSLSPQLLEDLDNLDLVCIDDIDAIAKDAAWEEAIFYLYNCMQEKSHRLLIAGIAPPKTLSLNLPDLTSRLSSGMIFQIIELSEEAKLATLQLRAKVRGIHLSEDVAQFLLRRCPRDMNALFDILETLDQASLTEQRKLTIPFVKAVLSL